MPPTHGPLDDGAILFALLRARGARQLPMHEDIAAPIPIVEGGGYASFDVAAQDGDRQEVGDTVQEPGHSLEEDPFGFGQLGFDDLEALDEWPTTIVEGDRESRPAAVPTVPAAGSELVPSLLHFAPQVQQRLVAHATHTQGGAHRVVWSLWTARGSAAWYRPFAGLPRRSGRCFSCTDAAPTY